MGLIVTFILTTSGGQVMVRTMRSVKTAAAVTMAGGIDP